MYKYKQTTDVEIGDLVVWTELLPNNPYATKNKVYQVIAISSNNNPIILDNTTKQKELGKGFGFKVLQTKPASEAVVGDYMYRTSYGSLNFPQHSVIKITEVNADKTSLYNLYYASASCVSFHEVIVIAQAEPEIKYPYFTESKHKGKEYICKILEKEKYIYIYNWVKNGCNKIWDIQPPPGEPCDFTTEPEVFDIDWWQQRFEAGLPVYVSDQYGNINKCNAVAPKNWDKNSTFSMIDPSLTQKTPMSKEDIELFKQQVPLSTLHLGLCNEISLSATTECSLSYPTIQKEKPMKFQDFINSLFTEEIKTDYEKKPNFLVTIYNSEGTEIAVTTATSVKSVEDILQSSPKLWGSKAVMYSIDSEVQVSVPVVTTKFKKPKEEK